MGTKRPPDPEDVARGERMALVRNLIGIEQEHVAEMMKVSRGAVGNWELGGGISKKNFDLFVGISGSDYKWLSSGEGTAPSSIDDLRPIFGMHGLFPAFKNKIVARTLHGPRSVTDELPYQGKFAEASPEVDIAVGAGAGGYTAIVDSEIPMLSGAAVRGEYVLPSYALREFTSTQAGMVHVVQVRGDSMEDTLKSGDRVFVDTADRAVAQGGVFVLIDMSAPDTNEVIVKRLRRLGSGTNQEIEIASDNPKERPPRVVRADEVMIIGRAVGRLTRI